MAVAEYSSKIANLHVWDCAVYSGWSLFNSIDQESFVLTNNMFEGIHAQFKKLSSTGRNSIKRVSHLLHDFKIGNIAAICSEDYNRTMFFSDTIFFANDSKKFSCLRATKNDIPKILSKLPSLSTHHKKISSISLITFHLLNI